MSELMGRIASPCTVSGHIIGGGPPGQKGDPGDTPVRGIDYWTAEDIAAIQDYIDEQLGVVANGAY